jgi:hypothetical protein
MADTIKEHLKGATESFDKIVDFGMRVSLELNGKPATDQSALASVLHTKMCINGTTILHTLRAALTDHSAIIALCRMIMEGAVFYQYLMEKIEEDEWECRVLCLRLHDTVNRIKLMRGFQKPEEHSDLRNGRKELVSQLKENAFFKSLPEERAEKLITGEHFYIRGAGAAVEKSGWNSKKYMAWYSYFSSHAHSAPMSFFRFKQQQIRFSDPSDAQLSAMTTALSVAEYSLLKASLLHLSTTPECLPKFDAKEIGNMENTLTDWKSHFEN